jgi:hypothetical protein
MAGREGFEPPDTRRRGDRLPQWSAPLPRTQRASLPRPWLLGIMTAENDAVYLPLKKGSNELVLAVSELGAVGDLLAG